MSLFLNYASAIIDITAKVAFLRFTVSGNTDVAFYLVSGDSTDHEHRPRLQQAHRRKQGPWRQPRLQILT